MMAVPLAQVRAMSPVLVIGNKAYSSWSLRPWLLLTHHGVPFTEQRLSLDTAAFQDAIGALSPSRRVPALHHDGLVVWDSMAICEYANETWLEGRGWPAARAARAQARSAAAEMHGGFDALRQQLPMNARRSPGRPHWDQHAQRDIDRVQALWRDLRAAHGGDGPFLCGGFGIVDAMFAPVVVRFTGYGVPMDDVAGVYADAIRALPAFRRWMDEAAAEPERLAATDAIA